MERRNLSKGKIGWAFGLLVIGAALMLFACDQPSGKSSDLSKKSTAQPGGDRRRGRIRRHQERGPEAPRRARSRRPRKARLQPSRLQAAPKQ